MVFASGCYPTEDASDEKDGSFNACNFGSSQRGVDLFFCRRRGSDAHVLTGALRQAVRRERLGSKIACGLSGLRVAFQCGP
jgi:hypothetical protein